MPPLSESPIPFSVSSDPHKRLRLSEEVSVLLQKATIEQVPTSSLGSGFYSRLFLVPKKKGGMRSVIVLSILNTYLVVLHFKMVHQGFYTPRNLVDIARFSRCLFPLPYFCGFQEIPSLCVGQVFQYRALTFGLAIAPLVFTKSFQVVSAHLHTLSI